MTTIKIEVPDGKYCRSKGYQCVLLEWLGTGPLSAACIKFGNLPNHNLKYTVKHPDCQKQREET